MTTCKMHFCIECGADVHHEMKPLPPGFPEKGFRGKLEDLKPLPFTGTHKVKSLRAKKIPNQPEWLKRCSMGIEHGEDWDCLYEGKTWALIRIPGHMYWSSIGSQRYGKTEFEVVRKSTERHRGGYINAKVDFAKGCNLPDVYAREAAVYSVHEGRMNKKLLASLTEQVDLLDKERP